MAAFLDACRFMPTAGGTTDWTYSSAVTGYQGPSAAGVVNGRAYKYRAESTDLTQWEIGEGSYNTSSGTLSRTTVLFTSAGTTSKVNFSAAPQVAVVALKEDLISVEEANSFTATQQLQARSNIGAAASFGKTTSTVFLSGSGTYTPPANCTMLEVYLQGGGGGGGGSGTTSGTAGSAGGNTTFGTSLLASNGGGAANQFVPGNGGGASGGYLNLAGGVGAPGVGLSSTPGGAGGISYSGSPGWGGNQGGTAGSPAGTNSGSGGGGGGAYTGSGNSGGGGGGGAFCAALITSPAASYSYVVGAGGSAQAAGTSGYAGGAGAAGYIEIIEHY